MLLYFIVGHDHGEIGMTWAHFWPFDNDPSKIGAAGFWVGNFETGTCYHHRKKKSIWVCSRELIQINCYYIATILSKLFVAMMDDIWSVHSSGSNFDRLKPKWKWLENLLQSMYLWAPRNSAVHILRVSISLIWWLLYKKQSKFSAMVNLIMVGFLKQTVWNIIFMRHVYVGLQLGQGVHHKAWQSWPTPYNNRTSSFSPRWAHNVF